MVRFRAKEIHMEALKTMFSRANRSTQDVLADEALARPALASKKLECKPANDRADSYLAEYAELAKEVGIMPPDLAVESFKQFLVSHDLPVYSLSEVIEYMDRIAERESKEKAGWEWRPLRKKDNEHLNLQFGTAPQAEDRRYSPPQPLVPGSDYYFGPYERQHQSQNDMGAMTMTVVRGSGRVYNRTIPLHAVRRVALIEREHKGPVAFFVSDYALAPAIKYPDPFLMAVVPNPNVHLGEGRFVIDFWDEPGFGIDKMLK
jgi:hypothetical protein